MGNYSRASQHVVDVTNPGRGRGTVAVGSPSEGENIPVAAVQRTVIVERENKSLNRNQGPTRPSANTGEIPIVRQGARKTGRVA